ncbi:MAG: hypothetical protein WCV68_00345 [Candidatus Paceibacterota bacterium]|jgi:hypothetical protein
MLFDREALLRMADEADREDGISSGPGKGNYPTNGRNCGRAISSKVANSAPFVLDEADRHLDSQARSRHVMTTSRIRVGGSRREY